MIDRRFLDVSLIVQGVANEPAENPTIGTQYIVDEMPTGDFENAEPGQIARYDGENWSFITPKDGDLEVINAESGELMRFDGVLWETVTTLGGGGGSGKSGSSSLLVVEDLAQVISSTDELPDDYILNYCIVDNGLNSPRLIGFDRYSYRGTYEDECYCYNGKYGFFLDVNSVLAGTNGKYYTLKPTFNGESLIEVSEMATGCFVFNKSCNMLYQFNGTGLELVDGNFIGVNYVGISEIARKWSDADYLKHIGETGLYFSGSDSYIVSPDIAYTQWRPSSFVTPKAGDLFASTNHGILYRAVESNSGLSWTPAAFLEKGSVIYNDFDKTTYLYNGTTLEKIKKNEFITVKDVCNFCAVCVSPLSEREASEGDKYLTSEDVKKCWGNEVWCKYSDLAYGNRYLVLSEDYFNFNEPCIYEYVESGQGNIGSYTQFKRYTLSAGTTILNEDDGKIYVYNGTSIEVSEKQQEKKVITPIFPMYYVIHGNFEDTSISIKKGDKYFDESYFWLYTAIKDGERKLDNFGDGVEVNDGERFISLTDFKFYTIKENDSGEKKLITSAIPKGYTFLNEADSQMYFFNGTEILMLKSGSDSFEGLDLGEITG